MFSKVTCELCHNKRKRGAASMTYLELMQAVKDGKYKFFKSAIDKGFIGGDLAKENNYKVDHYKGKYGKGFKVHIPRPDMTRYHTIHYYIET
jgi:hypothetical protein